MNRSKLAYALLSIIMSTLLFALLIQTTLSSEVGHTVAESTATSNIYLPVVKNDLTPIVPDTTEVLTEETTQHLVAISADGSEFTFAQITPELNELDPGDVIVSDVSAAAPYGFLRKVIGVTTSSGQVVVTTAPAALEDAIQQGSFSVSRQLSPDDIQGGTALPGVNLVKPSGATLDDNFYINITDVVLLDYDGDFDTTYDQIKANGSIELAPDFTLDLSVKNWELQYLRFTHQTVETAELEIYSAIELPLIEEKKEIAQYPLGYVTVPIGPVPVVIEIELSIVVGIKGSIHVDVTTGVTQQMTMTAGLEYNNDVWNPFSSRENEFQYNPPALSAGLDVKGYAGAKLATKLYGAAGPYAEVTPYLKLEADLFDDPWWQLYGGLEVKAGVEIKVMSHVVAGYEATIIDYRLPLAQAGSNNPPDTPANPSPVDGATVQSDAVVLNWTGGDPDGDNVTYDVYLEANDSTPDVLVSDDQSGTVFDPGILATQTHYYWQIIAEDEQGKVTSGPVWSFSTDSEIVLIMLEPQVDDLTVTINGVVTATNSDIILLNWQWGDGESGGQWFPASHTYAISGTYLITVTAYDDLGNTAVQTTTVGVGLPQTLNTTSRVSVASDGTQGIGGYSDYPVISADGRFIAFGSSASNLVPGDTNNQFDIFVHDIQTGQTSRVSVASDGTQGIGGHSNYPTISADGRYVAFSSYARNLVLGDANYTEDVFVHDTQTGQTNRISVASDGTQGNSWSSRPTISADGRYIAYSSGASNLVPGDTNSTADIFVHDTQTGETTRVSVASDGTQGEGGGQTGWSNISADGRYVTFHSDASNLVPGDTNNQFDIFVHDTQTGETTRVSVASDGTQGDSSSLYPVISADGRFIAFNSSSNLVSGDTAWRDIFVHDTQTGQTKRVSVASDGTQGNLNSDFPAISANGRYVSFMSSASNLVPGDTNDKIDIFVHDTQTGQTNRVSVAFDGTQGNDSSYYSIISADGRYVAFSSYASNLVLGDTNGMEDVFVHDQGD